MRRPPGPHRRGFYAHFGLREVIDAEVLTPTGTAYRSTNCARPLPGRRGPVFLRENWGHRRGEAPARGPADGGPAGAASGRGGEGGAGGRRTDGWQAGDG